MITRVICGFQTGADQAGARAAKALGIATGGMMPRGWKTEDGPRPEFAALYGAVESGHAGYEHRTRFNVMRSHGTLIFATQNEQGMIVESGSLLTKAICEQLQRPWLCIDLMNATPLQWNIHRQHAIHFLSSLPVANIAGNRESRAPGIGYRVEAFLLDVLPLTRQTQAPSSPFSGDHS